MLVDAYSFCKSNNQIDNSFHTFSQLFIADENTDVNEEDYQKALSLTPYVDDPADIRHKIWCSAILRDNWDSYNENVPLDTAQHFMFYKLINLCLILCKNLNISNHYFF